MAEKPKTAQNVSDAPKKTPVKKDDMAPKPWMLPVGLLLLLGGILWMVYGILTNTPPNEKKGRKH